MGADFGTYGFPFIDIDAGGNINGMINALETVIAQLQPDVKVISGHGHISSMDDMRVLLKTLKETRAGCGRRRAYGCRRRSSDCALGDLVWALLCFPLRHCFKHLPVVWFWVCNLSRRPMW